MFEEATIIAAWGLLFLSIPTTTQAAEIRSVDVLEFGANQTLFIGDNELGAVHAIQLRGRPAAPKEPTPFNIDDLEAKLEEVLEARRTNFVINDLAVHPRSNEAIIAVSRGRRRSPLLVFINHEGRASILNLSKTKSKTLILADKPERDLKFWDKTSARSLTITDIDYFEGELFISGLSNGEFSSVVRRAKYPFDNKVATAAISMFHAVHNQIETRSPIETLEIVRLSGVPHVVAVYMCTPIVVAPISAFVDGAKIRGKTIAELGWGNTPIDFLGFDINVPWMKGTHFLLTNRHRSAMLLSKRDIEAYAAKPGLSKPVPFPIKDHAGVPATGIAMGNVTHIADQGGPFLLSIFRDKETGRVSLGTRIKGLFLRISEFIDEYDFPSYSYDTTSNPEWQKANIRAARSWLMRTEGKGAYVK